MNKKIILTTLSTVVAFATPIALSSSCGSKNALKVAPNIKRNNEEKIDNDLAMQRIKQVQEAIDQAAAAKAMPEINELSDVITLEKTLPSAVTLSLQTNDNQRGLIDFVITVKEANDAIGTLTANVKVVPAIAEDGITAKDYDVTIKGMGTTKTAIFTSANVGFKVDEVNAKIDEIVSGKLFTPSIKPIAVDLTAVKSQYTDFTSQVFRDVNGADCSPYKIQATVISSTVSTTIDQSDANLYGTVASVIVKIASALPGTKSGTYTIDVPGFKSVAEFNTKNNVEASDGINDPLDFNNIASDGVHWNKGVVWESASQGMSFLMNLGHELGWKEEPDTNIVVQEVVANATTVDGFTASANQDHLDLEAKIQAAFDKKTSFWGSFKTPKTALGLSEEFWSLNAPVYGGKINPIISTANIPATLIVGGTHKELDITGVDLTSDTAVFNKIIQYFKTNPWGTKAVANVRSLTYDIHDNKIDFWLVRDVSKDPVAQAAATRAAQVKIKNAFDNVAVLPAPSSPSESYAIDPVGSDGTMGPGAMEGFFSIKSFGEYSKDGKYANLGQIRRSQTIIDGEKHDGSIIARIWVHATDGKDYVKSWHSSPHAIHDYELASEQDIANIAKDVTFAIANVKKNVSPSTIKTASSQATNPALESFINFVINTNITNEQITHAVARLNNGSHHMAAVQGFLRGWKNIDRNEHPSNPGSLSGNKIVGLSVMKSGMELLPWFHFTKDWHDYVKQEVNPVAPAKSNYQ